MMPERHSTGLPGLTLGFAALLLACYTGLAWSAPRTPARDQEVLERLPIKAGDPQANALRQYQKAVAASPGNPVVVAELAQRYFDLAMAFGDPRYVGYAEALISRFTGSLTADLLLVRGLLRQYRHAFEEAKADFLAALDLKPDLVAAQAWRGAVLLVQADYAGARQACDGLGTGGAPTLQAGCLGLLLAYTGQLASAYQTLEKGLALASDPGNRQWLHTRLAEVAAWQGRAALAERHYRSALQIDLTDGYLLAAWSDFLLDQGRPREVIELLAEKAASDPLLLRLALAHQQVASPQAPVFAGMLEERFSATRLRGDTTHRAEEARYLLHIRRDHQTALALALANYDVQREPRDARMVLEAAIAAGQPDKAGKVLAWVKGSGFQGLPISTLLQQLSRTQKVGS